LVEPVINPRGAMAIIDHPGKRDGAPRLPAL